MSRIVLLDSGPLGIVTNPKAASPLSQEGKVWLESLPRKKVTLSCFLKLLTMR
jgi:hypothetical protein